jgi:hypothetical protein
MRIFFDTEIERPYLLGRHIGGFTRPVVTRSFGTFVTFW